MIRSTGDEPSEIRALPRPHISKTRWALFLIWLVPLAAAVLAGFYAYAHLEEKGTQIIVRFSDGAGLKEGETPVSHLGVPIGKVTGVNLSDDKKQVLVSIELLKSQESFARQGAVYWTVRPQISVENVSGLSTVLSGPYIEATPGAGARATVFDGLQKAPIDYGPGVNFVLHTPHIDHLSSDAQVYYRGIEVGMIKDVQLSPDSSGVDVNIFIRQRFSALVQTDSRFWVIKAADITGGLFSGVQFKLGSLQSLVSGGIQFATPDSDGGVIAKDGTSFPLYDDVKKDWLEWEPHIAIPTDDPKIPDKSAELPHTPNAAKSLVN
jgi:paraquat-inducible protein B